MYLNVTRAFDRVRCWGSTLKLRNYILSVFLKFPWQRLRHFDRFISAKFKFKNEIKANPILNNSGTFTNVPAMSGSFLLSLKEQSVRLNVGFSVYNKFYQKTGNRMKTSRIFWPSSDIFKRDSRGRKVDFYTVFVFIIYTFKNMRIVQIMYRTYVFQLKIKYTYIE